ncbi:hypothetical protein DICA2_F00100 [Diutina catenulata]
MLGEHDMHEKVKREIKQEIESNQVVMRLSYQLWTTSFQVMGPIDYTFKYKLTMDKFSFDPWFHELSNLVHFRSRYTYHVMMRVLAIVVNHLQNRREGVPEITYRFQYQRDDTSPLEDMNADKTQFVVQDMVSDIIQIMRATESLRECRFEATPAMCMATLMTSFAKEYLVMNRAEVIHCFGKFIQDAPMDVTSKFPSYWARSLVTSKRMSLVTPEWSWQLAGYFRYPQKVTKKLVWDFRGSDPTEKQIKMWMWYAEDEV